jgi:hypothetical protein
VTETSKGVIAERVASTSGSVLTWVFGLLLLASGLLPMTAASAHHYAASSSRVDASGDAVVPGLRTFIHASLRASVRPSRVETAPRWDEFLPVDNVAQPDSVVRLRLAVGADVPEQQRPASGFLARAPPASA